jgi:enoyl-CoA hydratase
MMTATRTEYKNLLVAIEPPCAIVTINRPDKLNALNADTLTELEAALVELEGNAEVRGIVLTGSGSKSFVAGADINELKPLQGPEGVAKCYVGQGLLRRMEMLSKPIIAAVNGFALGGGCELALACDIRLASDNARLGLPEVSLGIIPGYGGTQRLPRVIGKGLALEMILSGEAIKAERAVQIGLVNRVVPQDRLLDEARELVRSIAKNGPLAVAAAKRAVHQGLDVDLDRGLQLEALGFGVLCGTRDKEEGLGAFLEKRKPEFKGA